MRHLDYSAEKFKVKKFIFSVTVLDKTTNAYLSLCPSLTHSARLVADATVYVYILHGRTYTDGPWHPLQP